MMKKVFIFIFLLYSFNGTAQMRCLGLISHAYNVEKDEIIDLCVDVDETSSTLSNPVKVMGLKFSKAIIASDISSVDGAFYTFGADDITEYALCAEFGYRKVKRQGSSTHVDFRAVTGTLFFNPRYKHWEIKPTQTQGLTQVFCK